MLFYLIDNDPATADTLREIVEDGGYGSICGTAASGADVLEDLRYTKPDIVVVELLPGIDGAELVRRARERYPEPRFILMSRDTSPDTVAGAYSAGADAFLPKPLNRVEVSAVLGRVVRLLTLERTVEQLRGILQLTAPAPAALPQPPSAGQRRKSDKLDIALHRLGISGDPACREITQAVEYLVACGKHGEQITVAQLCGHFSGSPKAMEQRIRRAATAGMVNLANIGIEDYANDTFTEYAGTLYHFEQIRQEMNYIRGKGKVRGRVSVKRFLYALAALCEHP